MIISKIKLTINQFLHSGHFLTPEKYLKKMKVTLGVGCFISPCNVYAKEGYLIKIGNYCRIAQNVKFFTHGGIYSLQKKYNDPCLDYFGKITIGDYVSIGEGARIMPGVTIGNNVIIGAGSVVSKSIPDNSMVAGNPIRYIGKTDDFYKKIKSIDLKSGRMKDKEKMNFLLSLTDESFIHKSHIKINE